MESGRFKSEREKQLASLVIELTERLNTATSVALHYHPCPDENKTPADHLDEVLADLKARGLVKPETHYNPDDLLKEFLY